MFYHHASSGKSQWEKPIEEAPAAVFATSPLLVDCIEAFDETTGMLLSRNLISSYMSLKLDIVIWYSLLLRKLQVSDTSVSLKSVSITKRSMCCQLFAFSGQKYYYNRKTNVSQWEHPGAQQQVIPQRYETMVSHNAMGGNLEDKASPFPRCLGCGGWGVGLVHSWGYCNHCTRYFNF